MCWFWGFQLSETIDDVCTIILFITKILHFSGSEILMNALKSYLQLCGGKSSEGIFVGAFLSMSSTAVVTSWSHFYTLYMWSTWVQLCQSMTL